MVMKQIRTSAETKAMIAKLKKIYQQEKFPEEEGMVTITVGYVLNTAFRECHHISDWNKIIDCTVVIEDAYFSAIKEGKTQITRFRLSDYTANGLEELTKVFSETLGLKAQLGFACKMVLKAALLQRERKEKKE